MIVYMQDNGIAAVCSLASSVPDGVAFIETDIPPMDKKFRMAWEIFGGDLIEDLTKSKEIAQDMRRVQREADFAQYDEIISKQIPGEDATLAEAERLKIREADAILQASIDTSTDMDSLRLLVA